MTDLLTPVVCRTCEGEKFRWETHAFTKKEFKANCPKCGGQGWILVEAYYQSSTEVKGD